MVDTLDTAKRQLLTPFGMGENDVESVLNELAGRSVTVADLYFEATRAESWILEDGIVKNGSYALDQGVGVRAVAGETTGFAYSDDIQMPALTEAARAAPRHR